VTVTAPIAREEDETMRERRCIATGEVLLEAQLIRFVADPDGNIVPDVAAELPGRGIWVSAKRETLERAVVRNLFSRAAKAQVTVGRDLAERVEARLVAHMSADLGLARRSGAVVLGFDNVVRALGEKAPPAVLVEASDGAADGRRKLLATAAARGLELAIVASLSSAELSLALGRENVIHAALKPGRLAERLIFQAGRLEGLRPAAPYIGQAGSTPAPEKGHE
jgi:uncharacterized protein